MMSGLKKISGLMLDLSGTVHVDDKLLPGVQEAVTLVRNHGIPIQFVTNTSKENLSSLAKKVKGAGLEVEEEAIFTSLTAAKDLVLKKQLRPLLLLEPSAADQFSDVDVSDPNCVLVGLAPSQFHYERMNEAFQLVMGGADLIAVNKSRYFQKGSNLSLGTGAFVAGLEFSADCQAVVVGKPSKTFFELAAARFTGNIPLDEILMVGDDVRDDVIGAQEAGLLGGLVKTGKYRPGDEEKCETKPNFVFDNLLDVAKLITDQK